MRTEILQNDPVDLLQKNFFTVQLTYKIVYVQGMKKIIIALWFWF